MKQSKIQSIINSLFDELSDKAKVDMLVCLYFDLPDYYKDEFLRGTDNA